MIEFHCSCCGQLLEAEDKQGGKFITCPECKARTRVLIDPKTDAQYPGEVAQKAASGDLNASRKEREMTREERRDYWKKIVPGWTEQQVRHHLGAPDEIKPLGGGMTNWKYGQWPVHGTVTLQHGIVVGVKIPPFPDNIRWWT